MTGIERLREFVDGVSPIAAVCGVTKIEYDREHAEEVGGRLRDFLADIADQIERETKTSSEVEKMKCDPNDVSMSAYDLLPADEREAIEWVREHGGLSHVKDIYHDFRAVVERLGIEWSESELHGLMDALDRRLMPEGCEWLRYESGEPVRFGDEFLDHLGNVRSVLFVKMFQEGGFEIGTGQGTYDWHSAGECVKRPAVLAADGEPLEVGQTVWDVDGYGPLVVRAVPSKGEQLVVLDNGGTNFYRYPEKLTHKRPDSWERIEEDATLGVNSYRERYGIKKHDGMTWPQLVREDLVRRCRALAERERGE